MTIRKIVFYPNPVLSKISEQVTFFDDALHQLIRDMFETCYHAQGVGLAAPQIGISKQLCVIDISQDKSEKIVLINPKIITTGEDTVLENEACLSVPGAYAKVRRFTNITVEAMDQNGKVFSLETSGFLAKACQHEIDHLNGILYIEYLSVLKRNQVKKKLEKFKKFYGHE